MQIGNLHIGVPVLLAPMAAVTDLPFRTICEQHGVGLTITEFLKAGALTSGDVVATGKMTASLGGRAFGVQIYGRVPDQLAIAAAMAVDIGASLVDINMGCPAKKVVAGACGSALMKEPKLAAELVGAVRESVPSDIPVTVKHRAGWDPMHLNAPEFAAQMCEAGAAMITVHGRTRSQGFAGESSLEIIARTREAVPSDIPVVGNGDVVDLDGYRRMREETGCDAVMVGRGARGNPWLFAQIRAYEAGEAVPGAPGIVERTQVFRDHATLIEKLRPGPKMFHELRKAVAWYSRELPGCNDLRKEVWTIRDPEAVKARALEFFEQAEEGALRAA